MAIELVEERDPLRSEIWCTGCGRRTVARLTDGREMYPSRPDLADLPFWICTKEECGAFVGTHHKTKQRYRALGFLATPEVKKWRMIIHGILDPLWKTGKAKRGKLYKEIGKKLGREYHTAEIYSISEAQQIYEIVKEIKSRLDPSPFNR